jgi:hypothetical protein
VTKPPLSSHAQFVSQKTPCWQMHAHVGVSAQGPKPPPGRVPQLCTGNTLGALSVMPMLQND